MLSKNPFKIAKNCVQHLSRQNRSLVFRLVSYFILNGTYDTHKHCHTIIICSCSITISVFCMHVCLCYIKCLWNENKFYSFVLFCTEFFFSVFFFVLHNFILNFLKTILKVIIFCQWKASYTLYAFFGVHFSSVFSI